VGLLHHVTGVHPMTKNLGVSLRSVVCYVFKAWNCMAKPAFGICVGLWVSRHLLILNLTHKIMGGQILKA